MNNNFDDMIEDLKKEISDNLTKRISFAPMEPAKQNHFEFKTKKEKLKLLFCSILCFISLILFSLSIFLYKENKTVLYNYNIKNDADVNVVLNDDEFNVNKQANTAYVSSLIKNIYIQFDNNLLLDKNYFFNKNLVATVEIVDCNDNNSVVYEYKDEFLKNSKGSTKGNYDDKTTIMLDYNKYNSISNKYRNKIKFATNSILRVSYSNNITTKDGLNELIEDEIIIPLSVDTVQIEKNYTPKIQGKVIKGKGYDNLITCLFIFSIILFILSLCYLIVLLKRNKNNLTILQKKYKKIMNNYNNIIEVENDYFEKNLITINIKYFVDLIDAQQELHIPILCYTDTCTGRTWFYIVADKYLYKYELNKEDEKI